MTTRKMAMIGGMIAAVTASTAAIEVRADADKVTFPDNWAKGAVYMIIDRPNNKQLTEYYASQEAIDAAKKGEPLPSGTTITAVAFGARLDEQGNPVKGPDGHFVKTGDPTGYRVMQKAAGWGTDYPDEKRNGEWEYQVFNADKTVNTKADLNGCFGCHKPQAKQDFVFTYDKLKLATR
jgi:Cytochrome P460